MEAGRKLDTLIAKYIMGWRGCQKAKMSDWWYGYPPNGDDQTMIPYYSTDIASAWDVMLEFGDIIILRDGSEWGCSIQEGDDEYFVKTHTPMLSICLAALDAIKHKEE